MPLCLSFFHRIDDDVLRNHAHYCRLYGYPHRSIESNDIYSPALCDAFKYSQILRHLRELPQGDWLLFLDSASVVVRPVAIEALLEGRDALVVQGPPAAGLTEWAMTGMLILRNTAANRTLLLDMIADATRVIALQSDRLDEFARWQPVGVLPCNAIVADVHVHVTWRMQKWEHAHVFVVSLAPLPATGRHGVLLPNGWQHDLRLQNFLVREVNGALMHGQPILRPPAYPALSGDACSSYNPEAPIAFVTLYTHHIATYARVSEHNVKRYCDRHGYAYHVYREVPAELDPGISGNWTKPWLIRRHLSQHQWVIWLDADMLFVGPARRFDAMLAGRDLLFAKDFADWRVNSGLLGFRNTPDNAALLDRMWQRISEVGDKATVYSSMGDQFHINALLRECGLDGEREVVDFMSLNTSPMLLGDDTLLGHFMGLDEPYRSSYMADADRRALRAG